MPVSVVRIALMDIFNTKLLTEQAQDNGCFSSCCPRNFKLQAKISKSYSSTTSSCSELHVKARKKAAKTILGMTSI